MILVHHPAVRTSLVLLLLAGCGDVDRKYQVSQPAHVYCPPSASDITPTRLADGELENGGFAFRGCPRATSACKERLKDVLAAWVGTADGPEDAHLGGHIRALSNSGRREPSTDPALNRFLVRDGTKQRYIFNADHLDRNLRWSSLHPKLPTSWNTVRVHVPDPREICWRGNTFGSPACGGCS